MINKLYKLNINGFLFLILLPRSKFLIKIDKTLQSVCPLYKTGKGLELRIFS